MTEFELERQKDYAMFAQINANHPRLKQRLEAMELANRKYLLQAENPNHVFRAQGRAACLEELIELLASAHTHLR